MKVRNEILIIKLIKQDMKHAQFVKTIKRAGINTEMYSLEIRDVVADLMGVRGKFMEEWCDVYKDFIKKVYQYEMTVSGDNLFPLAEGCYFSLRSCIKSETTVRANL